MRRPLGTFRRFDWFACFILLNLASATLGRVALAAAPPTPSKQPAIKGPTNSQKLHRRINPDARLHVIDEQGHDVAKFEFLGRTADRGRTQWQTGTDGKAAVDLIFPMLAGVETIDVVVRSPEFATATERFAGTKTEKLLNGEATMVLRRGEPVQVHFQLPAAMTWPADVKPQIYFDNDRNYVRMMRQPINRKHGFTEPDTLGARTAGPGQFEFRLAQESPPIDVAVYAPGFLQTLERGPFTRADFKKGVLNVAVPKPASLSVHFDVGTAKPESFPFHSAGFLLYSKAPGSRGMYQVAEQKGEPLPKDMKLTDLAPGDYMMIARTMHKAAGRSGALDPFAANPAIFRDSKTVTLAPGESQQIAIKYVPYDAQAYRGDRTAVVHVVRPDGSPAAGRDITIHYLDRHYGGIPVFRGKVPAGGEITLKNITAKAPEDEMEPYLVLEGWHQLGRFRFKTRDQSETFKFVMPPDAGDMAPEIELLNVATGKRSKLSDFHGRVVCLDFWATWCGPCQQPMKNLDKLSAEKGDHLKGKVVIVPLSIDDRPEFVTRHITDRGWTHLDHYWWGTEKQYGFEGAAARAFVISAVPTTFLIDRSGRILWRGHPLSKLSGKTLEARIEEAAQN